MNAEQKQRAMQMLRRFSQTTPMTRTADNAAVAMAALLQDLVDAPEPEPFGYFKSEPFGWTDCAETDDGAIALYTAPSEPKPVARVTGYYAGYLSIATVDGRVLPAGTALYTAPPASSVPEPLTDSFVQTVPDKCDRIVWRGSYYHLNASHIQPEPPADVARDAERYRWLRDKCRATGEHWGGRWSLVIEGPCPDGDKSSGAIDKAIDAAIKRQGGWIE